MGFFPKDYLFSELNLGLGQPCDATPGCLADREAMPLCFSTLSVNPVSLWGREGGFGAPLAIFHLHGMLNLAKGALCSWLQGCIRMPSERLPQLAQSMVPLCGLEETFSLASWGGKNGLAA